MNIFSKQAGVIFTLVLTILLSSCEKEENYNILFIAVDDLNDWVGAYGGHAQAITPNIDKLAASGIQFENAYCPASLCNPSRVSLMTGLRPSSTGVYGNGGHFREIPEFADVVTMPQWFAQHGYYTAARGKIFHRVNGKLADTISWENWQKTVGQSMNKHPLQSEDSTVSGMPIVEGGQKHFDWGAVNVDKKKTADYLNALWAAEELNKEHDRPFFVACGIFRPHLPWFVPQEYFDMFPIDDIVLPEINENDLDDIPPMGVEMSNGLDPQSDYQRLKRYGLMKEAVQAYLASTTYADECVGVLLDALENSKYKDNTIVVLWGDHGWHLGEKLHYRKFVLWEESCRVPLIVRVPKALSNGKKCNRVVNLIDLYPTLSELTGIPVNELNEGRSFAKLIKDPNAEWNYPTVTTMRYKNHGIVDENWRYISYRNGDEELYYHPEDPLEWTNLANNSKYDSVKNALKAWIPEVNVEPAHNDEAEH